MNIEKIKKKLQYKIKIIAVFFEVVFFILFFPVFLIIISKTDLSNYHQFLLEKIDNIINES